MTIDLKLLAKPEKAEPWVFYLVLGILILPLWFNPYFLTQDGPTHIYNAKILADHVFGESTEFYNQYYHSNLVLFPYWFGHIAMAFLVSICNPTIIEKIFSSIYIISFAFAFRSLIKSINPSSTFLSVLALPLVCNYAFQMGFYSYIFGVVFMLVIIKFWLKYQGKLSLKIFGILCLLFLLLYFTHATVFAFTLVGITVFIFFSFISKLLNGQENVSGNLISTGVEVVKLIAVSLPSVFLLYVFMKGAPDYMSYHNGESTFFFKNFLSLSYLVLLSDSEITFALIMSLSLILMLCISMYYKFKNPNIGGFDAFYIMGFVMLILHLYFSQHTIGYFERTQYLPWIFFILWMASFHFKAWIKSSVLAMVVIMVFSQMICRMPVYSKASQVYADYLSVESKIESNKTVLPLNFSNAGLFTDGQMISNKLFLFANASNLIGAYKPTIILANIPALYGQFPYVWKPEMNPWSYIGNLHFEPPQANFIDYRKKTLGDVDYVITWFLDGRYSGNPETKQILDQLQKEYAWVYTSPMGFTKLYKHLPPLQRKVQNQEVNAVGSDKATDLLNQSLQSYNQGDFNECIRLNKEALKIKPDFSQAWNNICASYNSMKMWKEACDACNEALKIQPDFPLAKNNLNWALKNLK